MNEPVDVGVVGGGIAGCATALFCAREGLSVKLFERGGIGQEASRASAGVLSPPKFVGAEEPLEEVDSYPRLSRAGYDFYPEFIEILSGYGVSGIGYEQSGGWYLAFDGVQHEEIRSYYREMKRYDRPCEWGEPEEIRRELPWVQPDLHGGYFFPEDARVVPRRLMDGLEKALAREGVELLEETPVTGFETNGGRLTAVRSHGNAHDVGSVVLAAGCWSRALAEDLDVTLPVRPRKGEMIRTRAEEMAGTPILRSGDWFLLPRSQGEVLIGSTVLDTGFDREPSIEGVRRLLREGEVIVRGLSGRPFLDCWSGLRPYAERKGGPFLGGLPGWENGFVNAGHYKTGILQGPISGRQMARMVSGQPTDFDCSVYGLERT